MSNDVRNGDEYDECNRCVNLKAHYDRRVSRLDDELTLCERAGLRGPDVVERIRRVIEGRPTSTLAVPTR